MNNKNNLIIIGVIVIITVVGIGGFYVYSQNSNSKEMAIQTHTDSVMEPGQAMENKSDETMMENSTESNYIEYSSGALDNSGTGKRLLFFYANWCPTCRPVDTALKNTQIIPDGLKVIRVNFNDPDTDQEEKALAEKYDVTYQHTFVQIDKNGEEIGKWSGGSAKEALENLK